MAARQEDFVFAEHVLQRGYATEEQIEECLAVLERIRGEMELDESLGNVLVKKGYLAPAQVQSIEQAIDPSKAGPKNIIRGYQLQERVGSGAMGSVYRAHHLKLDIPVALKVLRLTLSTSKTQIERLKREAQLTARLNHPNIVRSLDVGESNGFHYLAMEFVDGMTVREKLRQGKMTEKEALRIVREVALGLEHAHGEGVIHRDVKPGNIMLTKDGRVKLADLGLARGKGPSDLTLEHASIGTPQFLAPEQAIRGANATHRSDLFSLGASLYHLVTGKPPFAGDNLGEIFQNVIHCKFDPPESVVRDLSLDTIYIIHRLMRANPRERYGSATELLADLDRLERGEHVAPEAFKGDYKTFLLRRRLRVAAIGTAAAVAVAVGGFFAWDSYESHQEEVARAAVCRKADGLGAGKLEKAATLEQLRVLRQTLLAGRPGECAPEDVRNLDARIQKITKDLGHVAGAEQHLEFTRGQMAHFRRRHEEVKKLQPGAFLPLTRNRLKEIEEEIAELSAQARETQRNRAHAARSREDAREALRALADALKKSYVDRSSLPVVEAAVDAAGALIQSEEETRAKHEALFLAAVREHRYKDAHGKLDDWLDERNEVWRKQHGRLPVPLRPLFEVHNRQKEQLEEDERRYWEEEIKRPAMRVLDQGRASEAEALLARIQPKAVAADVKMLRGEIDRKRRIARDSQAASIRQLEERIESALEGRRYRDLLPLVAPELKKDHWTREMERRLEVLHERAKAFEDLYARLAKSVARKGWMPSSGDPYTFVEKAKRKQARHLLTEFGHEDLLNDLDFKIANLGDRTQRGYFLGAESYFERSPRMARELAKAAVLDLRGTDAWSVELEARAKLLEAAAESLEADAEKRFADCVAARKRQDYAYASNLCIRLLSEPLVYTRFVEERSFLKDWRKEDERRGQGETTRLDAGLPESNYVENVESGVITLDFDFTEWFPDDDKDVPSDVKDKRKWKEQERLKFWRERNREKDVDRLAFQLGWFNDALVPDKERGGAVLAADNLARFLRREKPVRVVTLRHRFQAEADWSIEFTVHWDKTVPVYFAVTAGEIQAAIVYGDPEASYGGVGFGASLFRGKDALEGIEGRLDEFRREKRKNWKKQPRLGDRAYLEARIPPGKLWKRDHGHWTGAPWKTSVPYRMRLQNRGGVVTLSVAPAGDKDLRVILEKRFSKKELAAAFGPAAPFRFVSLVRCRFTSVQISGKRGAGQ